jgi:hypothetical protein
MPDNAEFRWEGQIRIKLQALQNDMMQEFRDGKPVFDSVAFGIDDARLLAISLFPIFINQLPAILVG